VRENNEANIQIVEHSKIQIVELEKYEKDVPAYHKSKTSILPKVEEFFSPRSNNTIKAQ
jgi:hypothetical protein